MPRGNSTGPMGQGSMTGKGLGFCNGNDTPGFFKGDGGCMGRGFGRGRGLGKGNGIGRGFNMGRNFAGSLGGFTGNFPSAISEDDEIKVLKLRAEALNKTQQEIEKRVKELENMRKQQ